MSRTGAHPSSRRLRSRGFTLVELVTTMTLSGIIATFIVMFIQGPMQSYAAITRRAALVNAADNVMRVMARHVRSALPNSVRTTDLGAIHALELIESVDAVRYRETGATTASGDELDFTQPDFQFTTLGKFTRPLPTGARLVIYNVGIPGADAYEGVNVITPASTTVSVTDRIVSGAAVAGEDQVTLSTAMHFAYGSPGKRVFMVTGPVTYLCDEAARTIRRYQRYTPDASQANRDSHAELMGAGAVVATVANNVRSCSFRYAPGTAQRAGLVTLDITVAPLNSDERVRLLHQVHVENTP